MSRPGPATADLGFFEAPEADPVQALPTSVIAPTVVSASALPISPPPPPKATKQQIQEQYAPTVKEIQGDEITKLAAAHWLEGHVPATGDAAEAVVQTIWTQHLSMCSFSLRKVMMLEFSQYLEKFLWPTFVPRSTKGRTKSSVVHVLSLVVMVNEKFRQRVTGTWDIFADDATRFSGLVTRVLKLLVQLEDDAQITLQTRRFLLIFLIELFQSLEHDLVRNECLRLVNISVWSSVLETRREREFQQQPERRALWDRSEGKYQATRKQVAKEKMDFDRSFMSNLIKSFLVVLSTIPETGAPPPDAVIYCERFLEFMIDLEAQLPTRRHFNVLLHDHLVVPLCDSSRLAKRGREFLRQNRDISLPVLADWGARGSESGALFVQLLDRLKYYARFEIDDFTGSALSAADCTRLHYAKVRQLQKLAFSNAREEMEDFALANVGNIDSRADLKDALDKVSEVTLQKLCAVIGIRTEHVESVEAGAHYEKGFLIELLVSTYERRSRQIDAINALPLYPDEDTLFDETTVPPTQNFPNTHCLAIPKLNLQFLTIHDYLLRNFTLFRLESTYEIRQDLEDVVKRLNPQNSVDKRNNQGATIFGGWARMGCPIDHFRVGEVGTPKLGERKPSFVKADLSINVSRYTDSVRREWESLRPHDVLFLVTIQAEPQTSGLKALESQEQKAAAATQGEGASFRRKFGIKYVRGCEISALLGDDGRPLDDNNQNAFEGQQRPRVTGFRRRFRVLLDTNQYQKDLHSVSQKNEDVYPTFNIVMRRKPQENNFKAVLDTIRDLMQSDLVVPAWLQNVFLGYGDRGSAHFTKMENPVRTVDFRDTFIDWDHLVEAFPGKRLVASGKTSEKPAPPYVLTFPKSMYASESADDSTSISTGAKRKFGSTSHADEEDGAVMVRSYQPLNMGPYPEDSPRKSAVRFTAAQVEAIHAGTSPGLTMVVGPPGTGKTDVAVQIIANLYHNFPEQHTLIITHSNTALNQLFEKIAALDIDPRHILRLGRGQEDLEIESEGSWGKYGRVTAFLEKRIELLAEVDRLAGSLDIDGAHGSTCETASYFFTYHILSRWESFHAQLRKRADTDESVAWAVSAFPFAAFFADAPQPLFDETGSLDAVRKVAEGCWRHIKNIFVEIEEVRAFELLRSGNDRSNYLLVKEAKIIAMTCTHAALKRREFVKLGFQYDTVVMEESGQILEVETFIPLLLQNPDPDTGASRLKRVVMIGDHNQLPPVVKNMAFQRYGNMEQSLFARYVRLGVPTIQLDAQGRARPSLAELFKWKYFALQDLPNVQTLPEYKGSNPGFAFEYQAVDVPDFLGNGETEPRPNFMQNLGEAEYAVATYQYMRLLGYPAERISILTTYNGQKELIIDVLEKRCAWNPLFGTPHRVATVDQYQGQQNDYILLSLVRTKTVGHLRDVRRLIVAMSRARLGLYVFCRYSLFAACHDLVPVFEQLAKRPTEALWLRHHETYPATPEAWDGQRPVAETGLKQAKNQKTTWAIESKKRTLVEEIAGVEQMGVHVQKLMQKKVELLKQARDAQNSSTEAAEPNDGADAMEGVESS
ncbi:hypothetical protein HKX48_008885 [Thoreauomyces humboldtii]|nr:hypothetical protein HKX48_008885 [Thoreauomyces humboldtii]